MDLHENFTTDPYVHNEELIKLQTPDPDKILLGGCTRSLTVLVIYVFSIYCDTTVEDPEITFPIQASLKSSHRTTSA